MGIWLPFVDAYEAGLWVFWFTESRIIAVPRPALQIVGERLHCDDGPAVAWPNGTRYWFINGVEVPQRVVEQPQNLTPREISTERNVEVRRVMIERFGPENFLREAGARLANVDEYGKLWRVQFADDEDLVMVEVVNSTPEPDGHFKDYWIRVPPNVRTPRSAVAWTFGMSPTEYAPVVQT